MSQSNPNKIKEIIQEFFNKMGFSVEIEIGVPEGLTIPIEIKTEDPQVLIGKKGETLGEIQKLLKIILRRKVAPEKNFYIDLDINNYKKKKIEYLEELARSVADEVSLLKKEKTLEPMSSYERRIVHLELSEREDVVTESQGEGEERRIVIKPKP
jgi:spoIIIJ-associated protein